MVTYLGVSMARLVPIFALLAGASTASKCPAFEDVAALDGPVGNFDLDKYLGGADDFWFEVRSHNLPVLTTGCTCLLKKSIVALISPHPVSCGYRCHSSTVSRQRMG